MASGTRTFVQGPLDGGGKKIETEQFTVGGEDVHREVMEIGGRDSDELAEVKASNPTASHNGLVVRRTQSSLTASAPAQAAVGTSSGAVLSAAATRKGLILINVSTAGQRVSLGLGAAAVLDQGITLYAGDSWTMDEYSFSTAAINGISSAASGVLAIQEFTA